MAAVKSVPVVKVKLKHAKTGELAPFDLSFYGVTWRQFRAYQWGEAQVSRALERRGLYGYRVAWEAMHG